MIVKAYNLFPLLLLFIIISGIAAGDDFKSLENGQAINQIDNSYDPKKLKEIFEPFNKHTNKKLISKYDTPFATELYHNWIAQKGLTNNCSELIGSCAYYLCRETQKNCNANGYFISFGYQYCSESLINLSKEVSDRAKAWLTDVAICLQQKMEEIPNENSCSSIKKFAIQSHDECYTETNFCSLKIKDIFKILKMLRLEFSDARIMREGLQVLKGCRNNQYE
jgi:hypothetical protein